MLKRTLILFVILVCFLAPPLAAAGREYLISDSSSRLLTKSEIQAWDLDTMPYLFNEICARHGYDFKVGGKYEEYFNQRSWYKPNGTWNNQRDVYDQLSSIEWENIDLIKQVRAEKENGINPRRYKLERSDRPEPRFNDNRVDLQNNVFGY